MARLVATLLGLVFLTGCGGEDAPAAWRERLADDDLTLEKLSPIVIAAVLERFPDAECASTDATRIEVSFKDGSKQWCYLESLLEDLLAASGAAARAERLDIRLRAMDEARALPEKTELDAVVPLIRSTAYLAEVRRRLAENGADSEAVNLACLPLVADLWVLYAIDTPSAIVPLTEAAVEDLGLDAEALRRRAMANLEQRTSAIENRTLAEGMGMLVCGGDYESSLLLQNNVWKALAQDMRGGLVAAVPSRGLMVYADAGVAGAVERMRHVVQRTHDEEERPVSPTLLRWTGDGWEVLR